MNAQAKAIIDLADQLEGARTALVNRIGEIDRDATHTELWKASERDEARREFDEASSGLSDRIDAAAATFDEAARAHNEEFDLSSDAISKAAMLSRFGTIPQGAWQGLIDATERPAELRFLQTVAEKAHAVEAAVALDAKAAARTAPSVSGAASECWFIRRDPLGGGSRNAASNLVSAVNEAVSVIGD